MNYSTPLVRVPGYLPYESPVEPGDIPVPNQAFAFWPQGQFAPEWFPAGHKSFQNIHLPEFQPSEVLYGDAYGEAMGAEWAEKWGTPLAFLAGFGACWVLLKYSPWAK